MIDMLPAGEQLASLHSTTFHQLDDIVPIVVWTDITFASFHPLYAPVTFTASYHFSHVNLKLLYTSLASAVAIQRQLDCLQPTIV